MPCCLRSPWRALLEVHATVGHKGGGGLRLARASSTFLCRLKAEHVVLGWFLKEKKKEVADLTHMHGMSGLHIQNDNKIVYPLATVSPPSPPFT